MERHRRTHLPLTGRHAVIDCANCHVTTTVQTWSNVPWDCYACHRDDYERQDIHPLHTGAKPFPHTCAQCHRTATWKQATIDPTMLPGAALVARQQAAAHDAWFPLSFGRHRGTACASCHVAVEAQPRLVGCVGCHAHDVATLPRLHRGRAVASAAGDCLACHPAGARR